MITKLIHRQYIRTLALFTLFCFIFLLTRNAVQHNTTYNFLIWNLFLGFVPFVFAQMVQLYSNKLKDIWILVGMGLWLLFYPNAPYMITDFIHVRAAKTNVIYDSLLIFSFSMLSLFFGFYSLKLIQKVLWEYLSKRTTHFILGACLLVSSFGIYLGRILRLNSWDVFTNPIKTFHIIMNHLFPVTKNPSTYVAIFVFTAIQWLLLNLMQEIDSE